MERQTEPEVSNSSDSSAEQNRYPGEHRNQRGIQRKLGDFNNITKAFIGKYRVRKGTGCIRKVGDLNNVVKTFIGSSYLSLPFGFFQSGILLGSIALVIIVAITDHCCQLIIKCKKYLIEELCEEFERSHSEEDDGSYKQQLQRDLRYADIGRLCFGKWGVVIVDVFLVITQTGFCIAYFIFVGNTLHAMFPLKEITVELVYPWQNVTFTHARSDHFSFNPDGLPVFGYNNIESFLLKNDLSRDMVDLELPDVGVSSPHPFVFHQKSTELVHGTTSKFTTAAVGTIRLRAGNHTTGATIGTTTSGNETTVTPTGTSTSGNDTTFTSTQSTTPDNKTTTAPTTAPFFMNTTTVLPTNHSLIPATNSSDHVFISSAPDLKWLVLVPLLPFILFAYIRNIRKLGTVSLMANIAIFIGYFAILIYMLIGFKVDQGVVLVKWDTFPVFFGQVVCAFEGIGLVLPVEASMEENSKNFPKYLHGALFLVSCVLSSFGIVGYLRYGPHVQQVIVNNLPPFSILSMSVDACLILAIACTYPLQVFPVVEILERYIFKIGQIQQENADDEPEFDDSEDAALIQPRGSPKEVPTWKRNIVRTIVVLVMAGLSVLLRHNFAYIGAFVGSCGSTALAYVLPCMFHLKIKGRKLRPIVIAKDVIIIIMGIIGGVCGVVVTVMQIIESFKVHGGA